MQRRRDVHRPRRERGARVASRVLCPLVVVCCVLSPGVESSCSSAASAPQRAAQSSGAGRSRSEVVASSLLSDVQTRTLGSLRLAATMRQAAIVWMRAARYAVHMRRTAVTAPHTRRSIHAARTQSMLSTITAATSVSSLLCGRRFHSPSPPPFLHDDPETNAASAAASASSAPPSLHAQLRSCLVSGDVLRAARLSRELESAGGECDLTWFNMRIGCHEKSGDWRGAERVWATLRSRDLPPNSYSYCSLIQVWTRAGGAQLAKIDSALSEMHRAGLSFNAKDYAWLIRTAHQAWRSDEVSRWAKMADEAGLMQKTGQIRRMVQVHERQIAAAPPAPQQPPPVATAPAPDPDRPPQSAEAAAEIATLRAQLTECLAAGTSQTAKQLIGAFESRGGLCDVPMLNGWIGSHSLHANWRGAEKAWAGFHERNLAPNSLSYRYLIQVLLSAGAATEKHAQQASPDLRAKIDVLLANMHDSGLSFKLTDYDRLIKTAHQSHLSLEVHRFSCLARAAGVIDQLDSAVHRIAAAAAIVNATHSGANAIELWRTMDDKQKELALPTLLSTLATKGDAAAAEAIVAECKRQHIELSVSAFNAWISCYQAQGDWAAAERVWHRLRHGGGGGNRNLKPDSVSYRCLIRVSLHAGGDQLAKLHPLLADMFSLNLAFSSRDYDLLIATAHARHLPTEVRRFAKHADSMQIIGRHTQMSPNTKRIIKHMDNRRVPMHTTAKNQASADAAEEVSSAPEEPLVLSSPPASSQLPQGSVASAPVASNLAQPSASLGANAAPAAPKRGFSSLAFRASSPASTATSCAKLLHGRRRFSHLSSTAATAASSATAPSSAAAASPSPRPPAPMSALELQVALRSVAATVSGSNAYARALALVESFEESGGRRGVYLHTMWLRTLIRSGDRSSAEHVWARMASLGIAPNSHAYRSMLCVCLKAGGLADLERMEQLYAECQSSPANANGESCALRSDDLGLLLHCAKATGRPELIALWDTRARRTPNYPHWMLDEQQKAECE